MSAEGHDLGGNLRRIRETRGVTQRRLAASAHVVPSVIGDIEIGRTANPGIFTVYRIALALGVPIEELMGVRPIADSTKARVRARREN